MKKKILVVMFTIGVLFSMVAYHSTQNVETVNACTGPGCDKV